MSILDGMADVFGAAFGGIYPDGKLVQVATDEDLRGKPQRIHGGQLDVKVQVDRCTQAMISAEGYTAKSVRLIILQRNDLGEVVPRPRRGDKVQTADGAWWSPDMVDSDPGRTHWEARGTPTDPPPGP